MSKNNYVWTDELIETELLRVSNHIGNSLMPTRNEIRNYYGDDRLTNKISKTLGYYGWAKKLGLTVQNSDTTKAKIIEKQIAELLVTKGFQVEQMSQKFPYDLLVNGIVKVDVKFAHLYCNPDGYKFYSFCLRKNKPTCDIYILVARDSNNTDRIYILPSFKFQQYQISIGEFKSVNDIYLDRYDLIEKYLHLAETIA